MQTRLMTIMFIDVQGFTKRTASQTLEETKVFIEETRNFVREHLEKWNGKLIKTIGDGFLGSFEAPTSAIQAALEIQRKLEARNANILNPENFVRFRIGINTGEIAVDESGDVFGDPVNIAARIESFCEPNEVFISEATYLAINRNQFQLKDLGPQMFKNATREIRIYKILRHGPELGGASTETAAKVQPKSAASGMNSPASGRPFLGSNGWGKWVAGALAFLLLLFLFHKALRRVLRKPGHDSGNASDSVSLPPVIPLPGIPSGKVPLMLPALDPRPAHSETSASPPATSTIAGDDEDDDLLSDADLLDESPGDPTGSAVKKPVKLGFLKLLKDGTKDRQIISQLVKQGKVNEATQYAEKRYAELKASGVKPPANAFVGLANLYKLAKDYDKAIETLERGVRAHPHHRQLAKILQDAQANLRKARGGK